MNDRTLFVDNFAHVAESPGGIDRLREFILQLAVQGKLVPQCPNDPSASELLEEVKHIRINLVQEGKLPRGKADLPLQREFLPFEIPASWSWVKLGHIMEKMGAGSTPLGGKKVYEQNGVAFLRSQNVWNAGLRLDDVARISAEIHERMSGTAVKPGDVLLNITGASIGRSAVVQDQFAEANVSQHVAILRLIDKRLRHFLHLCIISPFFQKTIMNVQVGVSREGLSMARLREFPLPVPPLPEQARIVTKVQELMSLCDDLESRQKRRQEVRIRLNDAALDRLVTPSDPAEFVAAWQRVRENFDLLYAVPENVAKLRQGILQFAMQGKLVPQDPNDEPADSLLNQINAQREELVGVKGINRRNLPAILEHETPFSLPTGWRWARFGTITKVLEYGTNFKATASPNGIPVLRMNNIREGRIDFENLKYVSADIEDLPQLFLRPNDILFNRTNSFELVGKSAIYQGDGSEYTFASYLIRATLFEGVVPDFVSLAMNASYFRETQIVPQIVQQCGQANFNGTKLSQTLVPLPPRNEQLRIVERVAELTAICDALEVKLKQHREHAERLGQAIVNAAVNE